jgi:hypothetical protein
MSTDTRFFLAAEEVQFVLRSAVGICVSVPPPENSAAVATGPRRCASLVF